MHQGRSGAEAGKGAAACDNPRVAQVGGPGKRGESGVERACTGSQCRSTVLCLADGPAERLDLRPVGVVLDSRRIRGSFRHPHYQTDDLAIPIAISRVVQLSGKYRQLLRLPRDLAEKLAHIGVGVGLSLLRLARQQVHREESVRLFRQQLGMSGNELIDLFAVPAVADTGAENDLVEGRGVGFVHIADVPQGHRVAMFGDNVQQSFADFPRVAVGGGIKDEEMGHKVDRVCSGGESK